MSAQDQRIATPEKALGLLVDWAQRAEPDLAQAKVQRLAGELLRRLAARRARERGLDQAQGQEAPEQGLDPQEAQEQEQEALALRVQAREFVAPVSVLVAALEPVQVADLVAEQEQE